MFLVGVTPEDTVHNCNFFVFLSFSFRCFGSFSCKGILPRTGLVESTMLCLVWVIQATRNIMYTLALPNTTFHCLSAILAQDFPKATQSDLKI